MKAKLLELGYLEKDMAQLSTLSVVDKDTELTDLSNFFTLTGRFLLMI